MTLLHLDKQVNAITDSVVFEKESDAILGMCITCYSDSYLHVYPLLNL